VTLADAMALISANVRNIAMTEKPYSKKRKKMKKPSGKTRINEMDFFIIKCQGDEHD
jgi:hypothetical protein